MEQHRLIEEESEAVMRLNFPAKGESKSKSYIRYLYYIELNKNQLTKEIKCR